MASSAAHNAQRAQEQSDAALVAKAALHAAARLGIANKELARVLGVSEATVSRMGSGAYNLATSPKAFELALLFVRLYRSLDSIVGGDQAVAQAWLRAENSALGGVPLQRVMSIAGLTEVIAYLDARRAVA